MFAFWNDNLRQLPLGFPALGLLKSARGIIMETILNTLLTINKNYLSDYLEVPEWRDDIWSGNCLLVRRNAMKTRT